MVIEMQLSDKAKKNSDIIIYDNGNLASVIPYYFSNSSGEITDVYTEEYDYLWYLDANQTLDIQRLDECGIRYIDYGLFGFDLEFHIFYLEKKEV